MWCIWGETLKGKNKHKTNGAIKVNYTKCNTNKIKFKSNSVFFCICSKGYIYSHSFCLWFFSRFVSLSYPLEEILFFFHFYHSFLCFRNNCTSILLLFISPVVLPDTDWNVYISSTISFEVILLLEGFIILPQNNYFLEVFAQ